MNDVKCQLTVLMPTYNAGLYIKQAIDSVLGQTYTDFEFLIVDDGSTDHTKKIIQSYHDKRIKLIETPHQGIAKALNAGLQIAKGELIARFDADDVCLPNRLQNQITFLNKNPEYILVGSDIEYLNSKGQYIFTYRNIAYTDREIKQLKIGICPFVHTAVCYRKEIVLKAGGYDENAISFEDHLLWRKLFLHGKVCNTTEVLVKARFNPESITIDERWRSKRFMEIKFASLQRGFTTANEGHELQTILHHQSTPAIKNGSYYALIGKKYLWNNYNPKLARKNFIKCWRLQPQPTILILWMISFLPKICIESLYKSLKESSL